MNIDDILNKLSLDDGAMIVRPATPDDLSLCQQEMTEYLDHALPQDYLDFLSQLNGFAWNGIEFFSTDQVTDPETDYTLDDIVSANISFDEHYGDDLDHHILLGRADDDLYIYNTQSGHYEVLDMSGRDVMESFAKFTALFVGVVAPRM